MTSIQKSKNPKFKLINEWKEACPVDFNSRFIDVRNDVEYEIEHFKLKVSEEEIEIVIQAYIEQDLFEQISFDAPDIEDKQICIDAEYVDEQLAEIAQNQDLSRYIL